MDPSTGGDFSGRSMLGIRRRLESSGEESFLSLSGRRKRPRMSAMAMPLGFGEAGSIGMGGDRLPRPRSLFDDDSIGNISMNSSFYFSPMRHSQSISGNSSFTAASRSGSPYYCELGKSTPERALTRSISSSSLYSSAPVVQVYPENSAKHFLRHARTTFDYSPPAAPNEISARLLSCTVNNVAVFTRGNRVHYKNINTNFNTDISQLCKLSESRGFIRAIECGSKSQGDLVAIGTSQGYVQIWDVTAKKATLAWPTTKEISAMAWNGPILSVGAIKGAIRHYDTRLPAAKMKEQTRKVTRHQGQITCLKWNEDGKYLASGDTTGIVYCWELGQKVPLDVGEFILRRKKIQHAGKVTALAWAPWQSRLLATGDIKGNVRLWNINEKNTSTNLMNPGKLTIGAVITGMHFSPHCKELLTTHGAPIGDPPIIDQYNGPKALPENALVVHSFPALRHVNTFRLPMELEGAIGDSVMDSSGTKVIFATPQHGKIDVCDVWTKQKEVKKRMSFSDHPKSFIR